MKKQTKKHSIYESIANTIIGLVVSYAVQRLIFPLYGIKISESTNLQITFIFFVVSFLRSYALRRVFNNLQVKENNYNLHMYCFQCEINMPVVKKKYKLYCKNCGLIHK